MVQLFERVFCHYTAMLQQKFSVSVAFVSILLLYDFVAFPLESLLWPGCLEI